MKRIDKVYSQFLYDNFYNLVKIYHEEKKTYPNGGIVLVNMTKKRVKKGKVIATFMALELIPTSLAKCFDYDPNDTSKKYFTITCPPQETAINDTTDCFYLIIKTDKEEYVFNCWCEPCENSNGKTQYMYTFRHLEHAKEVNEEKKVENSNEANVVHEEATVDALAAELEVEDIEDEPEPRYGWMYELLDVGKDYFKLCKQEEMDNSFRRRSQFTSVLQNLELSQQLEIEKRLTTTVEGRQILPFLESIRKLDLIGTPEINAFSTVGIFSSLTLRHMNTMCELKKELGGIKNKSIIELGCSYGGLCYVLSHFKYKSYTLVDTPEVINLAKKVLAATNIDQTKIEFLTPADFNKPSAKKYDLLISEFTISELDSKEISKYLNNISAKQAYLSMNMYEANNKRTFKKGLNYKYTHVKEFQEFPKGEWPNYFYVCNM